MDHETSTSVRVILCTAPASDATSLARELLERRLVACVNIMPVRSLYRWEGHICDDQEHLLIMKTQSVCTEELITILTGLHPYGIPEIIVLQVESGYQGYLDWVVGEVAPSCLTDQ